MFVPLLDQGLIYIKGVGPTKSELLKNELAINTVRDLLLDYPMRYEDRTQFTLIKDIASNNEVVQIRGTLTNLALIGQTRKKRLVGTLRDESGSIELVWFRSIKWIMENLPVNRTYRVYGRVNLFGRRKSIPHPEIDNLSKPEELEQLATFVPVYRSTESLSASGLDSRGRRKVMQNLFQAITPTDLKEHLPAYLIEKLKFPSYFDAIRDIHFPKDNQALLQAERRLKFEEFFIMQIALIRHYFKNKQIHEGYVFEQIGRTFNEFYDKNLPFSLTGAQKRVLKEIRQDLKSGSQMNRLLQGDVGSGKTIVALMAMLMAIDNGFQACLMAPTEILAQQHYDSLTDLTGGSLNIRVGFLSGSIKGKTRQELLKLTRYGEIHILVGTHALIEEGVRFKRLGLAIIDEQHRFGVAQRAKLWEKGKELHPHILIMTATPIPRTLHMTLYGDLDVSVIDELPPGRKPIKTMHKTEYHRPQVIKFIKKEIAKGRQIYVVFPLIEESENLDLEDLNRGYERLLLDFPAPEFQISVVHGRMKQEEKDFEMNRFKDGVTHLMVATTVIEVGVNVPNASVMIIENSERFGLSQLHQLRGRVGRGADQSYCILMSSFKLTHEAKERLQTMVETNDGFEIAEVDLRLRGPGNLQGTQQSGVPTFKLANIIRDNDILKTSREIARRIIEKDPDLRAEYHLGLRAYLEKYHNERQDWSNIS
ncbi:MAG: ATP-dependent DNA helicase RecG [Saprospiraceae bacterium]|nr:ATP-dependent DNA helicase RecG [Saprospiraceae bacterium]